MIVIYIIVYSVFYLISLLPYSVLYALSDGLYFIVYHLVGYRRKVVRKNLDTSFPEKSEDERRKIERQFYHWLCDYFVETVKLMSVSREELLRHIEFRNVEQLEQCFDEGQTCAAILGHYCNWELLSATGLSFKRHKEAVCGLIYHPLHSRIFDHLFVKIRQSMGGVCIPKKDILRYLITFRKQNLMNLFGYIADQAPTYSNIHLFLPFLNHDTPVFTGAERIMRKMNNAVFYVDLQREEPQDSECASGRQGGRCSSRYGGCFAKRRGKYICTFRLITRTPEQLPEHEITRQFFQLLETSIRNAPQYYLWSHDRWRRTREEYNRRYTTVNGHTVKR